LSFLEEDIKVWNRNQQTTIEQYGFFLSFFFFQLSLSDNGVCRFPNVCAQKPGALAKEVALMLWICDQGIPFSAFDRPTWKNFEPFCNIKLAGSSTLVQHRLPPVFAEMQKNQDVLDEALSVVPILDGWETAQGGKIIGMIYSFLTDISGRLFSQLSILFWAIINFFFFRLEHHIVTGDLIPISFLKHRNF
jgi:hypothetical protein